MGEGEGGKGEDGGESMGRSKASVGLLAVVLPVQGRIFSSCHMMEAFINFFERLFSFCQKFAKIVKTKTQAKWYFGINVLDRMKDKSDSKNANGHRHLYLSLRNLLVRF